MLEFPCPRCQTAQQQPEHTAGQPGRCTSCGASIVIPWRSQPLAPEVNPYATTHVEATPKTHTARPVIEPSAVDLGRAWRDTWRVFGQQLGPILGVSCAYLITAMLPYGLAIAIDSWLQENANELGKLIVELIVTGLITLVQAFVNVGWIRVLLDASRGERIELGELFEGHDVFARLLPVQLLLGALGYGVSKVADSWAADDPLISLALQMPYLMVLLWLSLIYGQYMVLIADRRLGVLESLRVSRELTRGNRFAIFLLSLASGVLAMAGALLCGVGLIFTVAPSLLLHTIAYLQMTGEQRP